MDDRSTTDRDPGERPPTGRRLATPPSARYGPAPGTAAGTSAAGLSSTARAIIVAGTISLIGAGAIVLLAGILGQTAGLLAAVAVTGILIGRTLRGAGGGLTPTVRLTLALTFALDAVALGNLGTWAYALAGGGVLGPIDYLVETFGPLVPAEAIVAATAAMLTSR